MSLVVLLETDCAPGGVFTTKFRIVLHDLTHQMFDHLLADDAVLLARQFCNGLRNGVDHFICFSGDRLYLRRVCSRRRTARCRRLGVHARRDPGHRERPRRR